MLQRPFPGLLKPRQRALPAPRRFSSPGSSRRHSGEGAGATRLRPPRRCRGAAVGPGGPAGVWGGLAARTWARWLRHGTARGAQGSAGCTARRAEGSGRTGCGTQSRGRGSAPAQTRLLRVSSVLGHALVLWLLRWGGPGAPKQSPGDGLRQAQEPPATASRISCIFPSLLPVECQRCGGKGLV